MQLQVLILPKHNQRRVNLNKDRDIHNKDKVIHSKDKVIHNKDKDTHNKVVTQDKDKDTHNKDRAIHNKVVTQDKDKDIPLKDNQEHTLLPHQLLMTLLLMITRPKITHQHRDLKVNNGLHKIKLLIFLQCNLQ